MGLGRRQKGRGERPGAPVPVPLVLPAFCHQEIGNAAHEEGPGDKGPSDDGSHNRSAHGQVRHRGLLMLF